MQNHNRKQKIDTKSIYLSCVVPMHNESEGINSFIISLNEKLLELTNQYEIIIIDDGSTDQSSQKVLELATTNKSLKLIKFSRNFGKEIALTAGLEHAQGEVTLLIDSDFQHPLNLIPIFLHHWANNHDMVYGIQQNRQETLFKRTAKKCFYKLIHHLARVDIVPNAGDFRLLDKRVVESLKQCEERSKFMKGLYAWVGFKSIGIPFDTPKRHQGASSWHLLNLTELAITGITSFSNLPLRMWSLVGLGVALCSFVYAIYITVKTIILGIDVPGYASIMVAVFFFGGVQLCSIGVLGEYIARIFNEVKKRPKYIVEKKIGL